MWKLRWGNFYTAHTGLVDAHNQLEEDMISITTKLADLEDKNRRNNVKLRGISESVSNSELIPYIQQITILQSVSNRDLIIDRAHRIPKPKGIPESAPRDIIMSVNFYHIKEELIQATRMSHLPEPHQTMKLFADLSQLTIQAYERLAPITSILRQNKILYKWDFPTKLIVTKNGITHTIKSVADGTSTLWSLGVDISNMLFVTSHIPDLNIDSWKGKGLLTLDNLCDGTCIKMFLDL